MLRTLSLGVLAALALGGATYGIQALQRSPIDLDPVPATAPALPVSTTTLMLTLQLDADGGIQVLQALAKPQLGFQQPRHHERLPLQWTLHDQAGAVLARGGFDPHRICLDPAHAGNPPHMQGDQVIPHIAHFNVKVPALEDADRLEFRWVGRDDTGTDRSRALGDLSIPTLEIR